MSTTGRLASAVAVSAFALMVSSSAFAAAQSSGQQECINGLNGDTCKLAATVGKGNSGCVKSATKGAVAVNCTLSDPKGAISKSSGKVSSDETKNACTAPPNQPDFGYGGSAAAITAAENAEVNLLSDTYGNTDLNGIISSAKADAKCQSTVTKDLEKIIATKWKQYVSCKKATLKAGATSSAALVSCVNNSPADPNSIKADSKGKIAKTVTKLGSDITKDCVPPVVIATDFPGGCSGSTAGTLAACLDAKAECRICVALNAADGLAVNCDLFDDGIANGSCNVAGRYTQTTMVLCNGGTNNRLSCNPSADCPGGTCDSVTHTCVGGVNDTNPCNPNIQCPGGGACQAGRLNVGIFAQFPFPAGGVTIQDVGPADVNGVSSTVVPFPGGLTTPIFCVPALNGTTTVIQSGCGVGRIDWSGGSDFTVTEHGDTSESMVCTAHQTSCPSGGPAPDSKGRLDVQVGGNGPDTCLPGGGTVNAIVSIPVSTLTWQAADASCPDGDGMYNAGTDTLLAGFPQTLDLTTDVATAQFVDLGDLDGCIKSGAGPIGPKSAQGQCIDLSGGPTTNTVSVAAAGTIFTSGGPTYDLMFWTVQNAKVTGPVAHAPTSCGSPPLINFAGTATRCF